MQSTWRERAAFALLSVVVVGYLLRDVIVQSPLSVHGDLLDPFLVHAHAAIRRGEFPLWSSALSAGTPFFASWRTAVLSPFAIVGYLIPLPHAVTWLAAAPVIVGGVGMFVWLRTPRVRLLVAATGGLVYLLVPFWIEWIGDPRTAVIAWLPWLLIAVDRAVATRRGAAVALVALTTSMAVLSGDLRMLTGVLLLAVAYAVVRAVSSSERVRGFSAATIGVVLGILACAVQIVPFLEYVRYGGSLSSRARPVARRFTLPVPPVIEFIKRDRDVFRVERVGNRALVYGVQTVLGNDAPEVRWYRELLEKTSGQSSMELFGAPIQLYDLLNVKYLFANFHSPIAPGPDGIIEEPVYSTGDVLVYLNRSVMPRVLVPDAYVTMSDDEAARAFASRRIDPRRTVILEGAPAFPPVESTSAGIADAAVVRHYSDHRVTIDANVSGARLLVLSDVYYPGWKATVDGEAVSIHRANVAFRAVSLPEGVHVVEFRYRPRSLVYGLTGSVIGLFLIGAVSRHSFQPPAPSRDRRDLTGSWKPEAGSYLPVS